MNKIVSDFSIGRYRVLKIDGEIPKKSYSLFQIDGKEYKLVPIYDALNCIAIESSESFLGKQVDFV